MPKVSIAREGYLFVNYAFWLQKKETVKAWTDGYKVAKAGGTNNPPAHLQGQQRQAWLDGYTYRIELYGRKE